LPIGYREKAILSLLDMVYETNLMFQRFNVQFRFGFSIGKIILYYFILFFVIVDVNISDVFETRRGKKCVAINSYKFSEFRENKDRTKVFRCTNRKCTVTVKLTANLKAVISINDEHSEHDELYIS